MKILRRALLVLLVAVVAVLAVILWQPHALQMKVLRFVSSKVAQTTPYELVVRDVSGNLFTAIQLKGIDIRGKGWSRPLIEAEALDVDLGWRALWHKRIEIEKLVLVRPVVTVVMDRDKQVVLPKAQPAPPKKESSGGLPLYAKRIAIERGAVRFTNESIHPEGRLDIDPITLEARLTPEAVTVERFGVAAAGGGVTIAGEAGLQKPLRAKAAIEIDHLPLHELLKAVQPPMAPLRATVSGEWRVSGRGSLWSLSSSGDLNGAPLTAAADVDLEGPYKATLTLKDLIAGELWRALPPETRRAVVSADVKVAGASLKDRQPDADAVLDLRLPAPKAEQRASVTAQADLHRGVGPVQLAVAMEGLHLGATAQVDLPAKRVESEFQLSLENFAGLAGWVPALQDAEGRLSASGRVKGPFDALEVDASAHAQELFIAKKEIDELAVKAQGTAGRGRPLVVEVQAKNIYLSEDTDSPWDLPSLDAKVEGQAPRWQPTLAAKFRNGAKATFKGSFLQEKAGWTLGWDELSLAPAQGDAYRATEPGSVQSRKGGVMAVQNLVLSNGQGTIRLPSASFGSNAVAVDLSLEGLALSPLVRLAAPTQSLDGRLDGRVQIEGPMTGPSGSVSLHVSSATVQTFQLKRADLEARLEPPWIQIPQLAIRMPVAKDDIRGQGRVPMHLAFPKQPDLPITFHLEAPKIDPPLLTSLVPGLVIDKGGEASFEMDLSGRLPDVSITGALKASFSHVAYPKGGVDLRSFVADVRSEGKTLDIRELGGQTPKGPIRIKGKSTLPDLDFTVEGQDVVLKIPKKLDAQLNLALAVTGDLSGPDISGGIQIQEATYTNKKKSKKELEEEEAHAKEPVEPSEEKPNEPAKPSAWENTTMDVRVTWPRRVFYRDEINKIETSGDLRVEKEEDTTTPYATGRIAIVRGSYNAYGKEFMMDSGDIVFTGPPDINPLLNLRAKYSSGGTDVFVDIKGTAKAPELKLTSNPPLPEQDIISVLVVGRPLNQIGPQPGQPETTRSQQATALAGSVIGGMLTKELREEGMDLGLDVVRFDPTTTGTRLTVGRYIGQKLFVSYGQPLRGEATRVFNADYYINDWLTLEGQTGSTEDSHADIQFRIPLNEPPGRVKNRLSLPSRP